MLTVWVFKFPFVSESVNVASPLVVTLSILISIDDKLTAAGAVKDWDNAWIELKHKLFCATIVGTIGKFKLLSEKVYVTV